MDNNKEKWNEINFLLFENVPMDISESAFEPYVTQALRVLEWKEYLGDLEIRTLSQFGAANEITPDFIVKAPNGQKLFVIEIKQPNIPLTSKHQRQLFTYMRQFKLEYGILIGYAIQIFYDGNLSKQEEPILIEMIKFEKDNKAGEKFVELFSKDNFNFETLQNFTLKALRKLNSKKERQELVQKITSDDFEEKLLELIKQDFLDEYDSELIDTVLSNVKIEIKEKDTEAIKLKVQPPLKDYYRPANYRPYSDGSLLPIELNPPSETDFKRRLLLTKTAYITTFYKNGTNKQQIWNAHRFKESSGVLGNLRSRPEFRNGEWQRLGIEKVIVSIDRRKY